MADHNIESVNIHAAWLHRIRGLGLKTILRLYHGLFYEDSAVLKASFTVPASLLNELEGSGFAAALYALPPYQVYLLAEKALPGDGGKTAQSIIHARSRTAEEIGTGLAGAGIGFVSLEDGLYPSRLRNIPDPPYGIYYKGCLPADSLPVTAVIGTRNADAYGKDQARQFASYLSARGIGIISGLARGIDGIAGRAALRGSGRSYAVLGSGVDICYPRENSDLYYDLIEQGGIISEYPPGTQPKTSHFPMRNRIISGLSDVLLVIEARLKSGTMITTDHALAQGRDVFALPGRVCDSLSDGCNLLISQGAGIACSPAVIEEYLLGVCGEKEKEKRQIPTGRAARTAGSHKPAGLESTADNGSSAAFRREREVAVGRICDGLTSEEALVYRSLSFEDPMPTDMIIDRCRSSAGRALGASEVVRTLMLLLMRGLAVEDAIGLYRRAPLPLD